MLLLFSGDYTAKKFEIIEKVQAAYLLKCVSVSMIGT